MRVRLIAGFTAIVGVAAVAWLVPAAGGSSFPTPHDYFAVVNANGTLARGTPGATVRHRGVGRYDVSFPGSVANCAAVANLGYAGATEVFTHVTAVTASSVGSAVQVDVTDPGPTTAGSYPHTPVLVDDSFHLHVDCDHALFANVAANGALQGSSPGVTIRSHIAGSGQYLVGFNRDLSKCAPVATVHNAKLRTASAVQAHLALGADGQSVQVAVNRATTQAVDQGFSVIVTCGEEPVAVFAVSGGFFNTINVPQVTRCALTGSWYNSAPGGVPQDQGYVSTWATSATTGTIQTKNGGYGVQSGFGADLVATC